MTDDMAVYIANLGRYNEGYLVGAWFTFPIDEEDVKEKIGLNEQYEEYAIHDTNNFPIAIGEYVSIEELNEMYEMIEELPDYIAECLDEFISHYGTLEEVVEHKDDMDDLNVAIQSYNYGGGYVGYVAGKGKKHTFNLAESFAREKSGGKKVTYTNPIAVAKNGGWRYQYGNQFYVELVNQYLTVPQVSGELAQKVMNEALKYQGWKYVYGGSNPNTSFDCSGLTQWCYGKAGISLPRTAQAQYDATQHLPLSQAKAGDLVFFHSTYNAGSYVTHVGIYVGNNQMYHAGDPIGYADLNNSYWQQHLIGAGRVKQ